LKSLGALCESFLAAMQQGGGLDEQAIDDILPQSAYAALYDGEDTLG